VAENNGSAAPLALAVDEAVVDRLDLAVEQGLAVVGVGQRMRRAMAMAAALGQIDALLTPEVMAPVMKLQGSRLGFRTDQDKQGGYPAQIVKRCMIEALLTGLYPVGNQFNVIAGNTYVTQEGCEHLLGQVPGLTYEATPGLPDETVEERAAWATVPVTVSWKANGGEQQTRELTYRVKGALSRDGAAITSTEAYQGKARRKALAWLIRTLKGVSVVDGDVAEATPVQGTATTVGPTQSLFRAPQAAEAAPEAPAPVPMGAPAPEVDREAVLAFLKEIEAEVGSAWLQRYLVSIGYVMNDDPPWAVADSPKRAAAIMGAQDRFRNAARLYKAKAEVQK